MSDSFLLVHGRLLDGTGEAPVDDGYLLVDQGRITAIGSGLPASAGTRPTYDLGGRTVIPGLIDGHVHLLSSAHPDRSRARDFDLFLIPEEKTLHAAANATLALAAGVTTVRDMAGSRPEVAVKRAAEDGVIEAARVISAGFVGMTAGHGDMFFPPAAPTRPWRTADGEVACRTLVREYAREGHDLIKICTSGGVLSKGDRPGWRNYTDAEVNAVTDEAHALGLRVAAHAHTKVGIVQAIRGGVDTIEHGSMLDEECVKMMLERNVALCPTLTLQHYMDSGEADPPLSAEVREKARQVHGGRGQALRLAHEAGVHIFAGTDSCNSMAFGRHARELQLLVEVAGMTPMEAVVAATGAAAEALGIDAITGSLAAGKSADLLVLDGDPLADISLLQDLDQLHVICKQGRATAKTAARLESLRADPASLAAALGQPIDQSKQLGLTVG